MIKSLVQNNVLLVNSSQCLNVTNNIHKSQYFGSVFFLDSSCLLQDNPTWSFVKTGPAKNREAKTDTLDRQDKNNDFKEVLK